MSAPRTTTRAGSSHLIAQLSAQARRMLHTEAASAGLLVLATLLALAWANSPWSGSYERVWHTEFSLRLGSTGVTENTWSGRSRPTGLCC